MSKSTENTIICDRKFECQRCGFCCSEMAIIYPSAEEVFSLSKYLGISELSFAVRYLRELYDSQANMSSLAFRTNSSDGNGWGCIFCQDNSCAIYNSSRTEICKIFPWNHFDLDSRQWEKEFILGNGKPLCAGIGAGREWSLDEIRDIKNAYQNVGIKTKTQRNSPTEIIGANISNNSSILSFSEENFIQKFRSLSIGNKEEVRRLIDSLYHI